jgi:hypothetical protein
LLCEQHGFFGREDVFLAYFGFSLSSVTDSVSWTVYGDADVHAKYAYVGVVFHAWNFDVFL